MKKEYVISDLSPHLFWDVDIATVDWQKHRAFIFERVMLYGDLRDWLIINRIYGVGSLKLTARNAKHLDDFSISFLSLVLGIKKESFACYKNKRSQASFWNY